MKNTSAIKKYTRIARLGWLDAVEYRTDFFMSVFGWGIRLAIATFLWKAVSLGQGGMIGSYDYSSIMTYFLLVQILSSFVFSHTGFLIADDVAKGEFNQYLLKPIAYLPMRFLFDFSRNIFRTLMGSVIFGIIIWTFYGGIPIFPAKIPLIIASIIGGYIINFCMLSMLGMSAFWFENSKRIIFIYFGMLTIFSGMIVPLNLFPPQYLNVIANLPFGYIFFYPIQVLQATTITPLLMQGLLHQWAYGFALYLLALFIFRRGIRRFEGVGI